MAEALIAGTPLCFRHSLIFSNLKAFEAKLVLHSALRRTSQASGIQQTNRIGFKPMINNTVKAQLAEIR
jgi:hypothetical protein